MDGNVRMAQNINNCHYLCKRCGALKRARVLYRSPKKPYPKKWPRCCAVLMQAIDDIKAAAAVNLSPSDRIKGSSLGQFVCRGHRKGLWKAALSDRQIAQAKEEFAAYHTPGHQFVRE